MLPPTISITPEDLSDHHLEMGRRGFRGLYLEGMPLELLARLVDGLHVTAGFKSDPISALPGAPEPVHQGVVAVARKRGELDPDARLARHLKLWMRWFHLGEDLRGFVVGVSRERRAVLLRTPDCLGGVAGYQEVSWRLWHARVALRKAEEYPRWRPILPQTAKIAGGYSLIYSVRDRAWGFDLTCPRERR